MSNLRPFGRNLTRAPARRRDHLGQKRGGTQMRNFPAISAVVLSVAFAGSVVAGCSSSDGGDKKASGEAASQQPAAPSSGDLKAKLMVANQGYVDALVKGDVAGASGYLDPKVCDDEDRGSMLFAVNAISKTANGATMKITRIELYGDGTRGGAADYELSKNASDAFRRLVKSSIDESKKGSWSYHDGEWYLAGPCEDDASPSPSSTT